MGKEKFIKGQEELDYKQRLLEFQQQINPKPSKEEWTKLLKKYQEAQGIRYAR